MAGIGPRNPYPAMVIVNHIKDGSAAMLLNPTTTRRAEGFPHVYRTGVHEGSARSGRRNKHATFATGVPTDRSVGCHVAVVEAHGATPRPTPSRRTSPTARPRSIRRATGPSSCRVSAPRRCRSAGEHSPHGRRGLGTRCGRRASRSAHGGLCLTAPRRLRPCRSGRLGSRAADRLRHAVDVRALHRALARALRRRAADRGTREPARALARQRDPGPRARRRHDVPGPKHGGCGAQRTGRG